MASKLFLFQSDERLPQKKREAGRAAMKLCSFTILPLMLIYLFLWYLFEIFMRFSEKKLFLSLPKNEILLEDLFLWTGLLHMV